MTIKHRERYYGIDILRLIWLLAIIYFHCLENFFYSNEMALEPGFSFSYYASFLVRCLVFSGFAIVTLSSFLLGWIKMGFRKWCTLMGILALGALFLSWLQGTETQPFFFQWDIYNFHFASFALIAVLQIRMRLLYSVTLLLLPLLVFPIWQWDYLFDFNASLKDILLGDCSINEGYGSWPLFPWLAIPLAMYSAAKWIQSHPNVKKRFHAPEKQELWIWGALLLASLPWLGGYYWTPIGPDFSCYVHRRPPIEFWSQWLWVLFLMRISFIEKVNEVLKPNKTIQFLSSLQWSKNMGLAYALHFIFLNIGYNWADEFRRQGLYLDLFFVFLVAGVEVSCRFLGWCAKQLIRRFRPTTNARV